MSTFKSPFEKLSVESLQQITENTEITAKSVQSGGSLFSEVSKMVSLLKRIEKNTRGGSGGKGGGKGSSGGGLGGALALKVLGGKGIAAIAKGLAVLVDTIDKVDKPKDFTEKADAIVYGVNVITGIGPAILKFAGYLLLATPLLVVGAIAAPLFGLAMFIIVKTLQLATKPLTSKKTQAALQAISGLGKSILMLGLALVLAVPLYGFGIASLPFIAITLLTLGGVFWLLDKLDVDKSMKDTSKAFLFTAAAILAVGLSIFFVGMLFQEMESPYETLAFVGLLVVGVGIAFALAGMFDKQIAKGALVMILSAIPIILLGLAVQIFANALPKENPWEFMAQIGVFVTGVGLAMAGAGALSFLILPGAFAMLVAGMALVTIGLGVKTIGDAFSSGAIDDMLADSGHVTESFLGFGGGRMMSKMEYFMYSLANSFTLNPLSTASMYVAAPALILAGMALITIAKGIKDVIDLDIDYKVVGDNIATLTTTLAGSFGAIGERFPGGSKSLMASIFGGGSQSAVADGIDAVNGMGAALTDIAVGVDAMAQLKFPIYKKGKIVDYFTLSSSSFGQVNDNIVMIVDSLGNTFGNLGKMYPAGRRSLGDMLLGRKKPSPVAAGIGMVNGMGAALADIASGIDAMSQLKFPIYKDGKIVDYFTLSGDSFKTVNENINLIVSSLSDTFARVGLRYPAGKKSLMNMITGDDTPSPVAAGISFTQGMGSAIADTAKGVQAIANLRMPIYDDKGEITGYREMTEDDFTNVDLNINRIIDSMSVTFARVARTYPAGKKSLMNMLTGKATPSPVAAGVSFVQGIGGAIKDMAEGVQMVAELKMPIYDENGKITGYEKMDPKYLTDVNTVIQDMIVGMTKALGTVGSDKKANDGGWWGGASSIEKGVELVKGFAEPILSISKTAEIISKIPIDGEELDEKITSLIKGLTSALTGELGGVDVWGTVSLDDKAKAFKTISKSYTEFAKASKNIEIKAVEASTEMFKAINELAMNDGASAMKVFAEELMVAVEQLSGTVMNLEASVNTQTDTTKQSTDALSGTVKKMETSLTATKKAGEEAAAGEGAKMDLQPLIMAIQELEARFDSAIRVINVSDSF